eukprot:jgi/Mesvir1/28034/Mv04640-RA.1
MWTISRAGYFLPAFYFIAYASRFGDATTSPSSSPVVVHYMALSGDPLQLSTSKPIQLSARWNDISANRSAAEYSSADVDAICCRGQPGSARTGSDATTTTRPALHWILPQGCRRRADVPGVNIFPSTHPSPSHGTTGSQTVPPGPATVVVTCRQSGLLTFAVACTCGHAGGGATSANASAAAMLPAAVVQRVDAMVEADGHCYDWYFTATSAGPVPWPGTLGGNGSSAARPRAAHHAPLPGMDYAGARVFVPAFSAVWLRAWVLDFDDSSEEERQGLALRPSPPSVQATTEFKNLGDTLQLVPGGGSSTTAMVVVAPYFESRDSVWYLRINVSKPGVYSLVARSQPIVVLGCRVAPRSVEVSQIKVRSRPSRALDDASTMPDAGTPADCGPLQRLQFSQAGFASASSAAVLTAGVPTTSASWDPIVDAAVADDSSMLLLSCRGLLTRATVTSNSSYSGIVFSSPWSLTVLLWGGARNVTNSSGACVEGRASLGISAGTSCALSGPGNLAARGTATGLQETAPAALLPSSSSQGILVIFPRSWGTPSTLPPAILTSTSPPASTSPPSTASNANISSATLLLVSGDGGQSLQALACALPPGFRGPLEDPAPCPCCDGTTNGVLPPGATVHHLQELLQVIPLHSQQYVLAIAHVLAVSALPTSPAGTQAGAGGAGASAPLCTVRELIQVLRCALPSSISASTSDNGSSDMQQFNHSGWEGAASTFQGSSPFGWPAGNLSHPFPSQWIVGGLLSTGSQQPLNSWRVEQALAAQALMSLADTPEPRSGMVETAMGELLLWWSGSLFFSSQLGILNRPVMLLSQPLSTSSLPARAAPVDGLFSILNVCTGLDGQFAVLGSTGRVFAGSTAAGTAVELLQSIPSSAASVATLAFDASGRLSVLMASDGGYLDASAVPGGDEAEGTATLAMSVWRLPVAGTVASLTRREAIPYCPVMQWDSNLPPHVMLDYGESFQFLADVTALTRGLRAGLAWREETAVALLALGGGGISAEIAASNATYGVAVGPDGERTVKARHTVVLRHDPLRCLGKEVESLPDQTGDLPDQVVTAASNASTCTVDRITGGKGRTTRAFLRASPARVNLACAGVMQSQVRVEVGCPPLRHVRVRVRSGQMGVTSSKACKAAAAISPTGPPYKERSGFGKGSGWVYLAPSCPARFYIEVGALRPVLELWDGDTFAKPLEADFVVWEADGRRDFTYATTVARARCAASPLNWAVILSHATLGAGAGNVSAPRGDSWRVEALQTLDWSTVPYRSCFQTGDAAMSNFVDGQEGGVGGRVLKPHAPYEVLNSSGVNGIVFEGHTVQGGIYNFRLRVMDPAISFCELHAAFSIDVYGVPMQLRGTLAVVLALGLYDKINYMPTIKRPIVMLPKGQLRRIWMHIYGQGGALTEEFQFTIESFS